MGIVIDTHCHIDMLQSPEAYLKANEGSGNITIGMTNLPSHFEIGYPHFKGLRHSRLALGFHPQLAKDNQAQLKTFSQQLSKTSYIGEVGLDFSKCYLDSADIQLSSFDYICKLIGQTNKIVSVHSRRAEKYVLEELQEYGVKNVIFHWYSGPLGLISDILDAGYYFSINEAMTLSESGKRIINRIPQERILTESDDPYNNHSNITNAIINMGISLDTISSNFKHLLQSIKS